MLGGPTWLFWTVTWSMGVFGIGRYRCLRFGIVGIIATVGQLKIFKICLRTIRGRFTGRTSMWIFDFGDVKGKDCVAGNGEKGKRNKPCPNLPDVQIQFSLRSLCFVSLRQFSIRLAFSGKSRRIGGKLLAQPGFLD